MYSKNNVNRSKVNGNNNNNNQIDIRNNLLIHSYNIFNVLVNMDDQSDVLLKTLLELKSKKKPWRRSKF